MGWVAEAHPGREPEEPDGVGKGRVGGRLVMGWRERGGGEVALNPGSGKME